MTFTPEQLAVVVAGVFGACVGSFLNVVIYRLPAGKSVVTPPSSCPHCGHRLAFYENVPVLAWLALRGKCRKCRTPISAQYPLIESLTGLLFAGLVAVYYFTPLRVVFGDAGLDAGTSAVVATWPVLVVHLVLVAVMIAATMIDARHYIIPIQLPWLVAVIALIVPPVALLTGQLDAYDLNPGPYGEQLVPILPPIDLPGFNFYLSPAQQLAGAFAAAVGLLLSNALMYFKVLPRSFDDGGAADDAPHESDAPLNTDPNAPDSFLHHPHPRREIGKELLFLAPAVVLALIAALLAPALVGDPALPAWLHTVGGVTLGGLIGGGVVWAIRIFGTLLFGKEAMGLGDVHLMVGVGAVIGWADVTLAFFLAPFFGIAGAVATAGLSVLTKGRKRAIPFGPYLCAATLLVMVFRTPIFAWLLP